VYIYVQNNIARQKSSLFVTLLVYRQIECTATEMTIHL